MARPSASQDLGYQPSTGATDSLRFGPPFPPAAERCALAVVERWCESTRRPRHAPGWFLGRCVCVRSLPTARRSAKIRQPCSNSPVFELESLFAEKSKHSLGLGRPSDDRRLLVSVDAAQALCRPHCRTPSSLPMLSGGSRKLCSPGTE